MMDAERWSKIQSIFHLTSDLPPEQQGQEVETLCAGDEDLAEIVKNMLREDATGGARLDADISRIAETMLRSDPESFVAGRQIGPYRLLRVLGEGGSGVVYLAERIGIGGQVAIKLLRDAWLSPMRRRRFVLEQHTLVKLNHSAIARIYDASMTEDGTPWFVMEFADGVPITEYLRDRKGSLRDDLMLYRRVCEAVQYIHGHAIIHRDLKPSNILVTKEGDPKLLDFGIAKEMGSAASQEDKTVTGMRWMTPAYAAPEQYENGNIGVFTDVYVLGVLLYEILTGELPPKQETQHPIVLEKPSSVAKRQVRRIELSRREWADLDVLCLTALQPEPARRYHSVDALIRDLTAYLDGNVLEARPVSFAYQAGKFIRKNSAVLGTISAAILLLLGAGIFFTVRLAHARNAALAEAARTIRLQKFTESLFDGGDANVGPEADLKVTEILQRGRAEADSLTEDPRMEADMFEVLGTTYQNLGRFKDADLLLQRSLEIREKALGPSDPQYAESLVALGLLREEQRKMDDAEMYLHKALALQLKSPQTPAQDLERAQWALGSVQALRGDYEGAQKTLEAVVHQTAGQSPTAQQAEDLTELANVHFYKGEYELSDTLNRQALAINEKLFGEHHPSVAENFNNLGDSAFNRGRYSEAESYANQSLSILQTWYGPDHPQVADTLTKLATYEIRLKKYDLAETSLKRALDIQLRAHGPHHPSVALALNELGNLEYIRDHDDDAEKYFQQALAIWLDVYGDHHQFVGLSYAHLCGVSMDRKDYPAAEQMCRKALAVYQVSLTDNHVSTATVHVRLGRILMRQKKFAAAEPETLQGYHFLVSHVGRQDSYLIGARKDMAEIETQLGKPQDAAKYLAELNQPNKPTP